MHARICVPLVLGSSVVAAASSLAPSAVAPPAPAPRSAPTPVVRPFSTTMPIDTVRVVPEGQVLPGVDPAAISRADYTILAPNARRRTYVTSMPIITSGNASFPKRPTPPRPATPPTVPSPGETSPPR